MIAQALAWEEHTTFKPWVRTKYRVSAPALQPGNLDLKLVDKVIGITNREAISTARRLMEKKRILAGIFPGPPLPPLLKLQEDEAFYQ